jgi:hypothetical protein
MAAKSPPRIYCIPATEAPVVAVFRRGPSRWSHVGRWDLESGRYEPGAWLAGRIFPRRSDLSPDGRFLCYFAHKPNARWEEGDAYVAISRLPWLTALHAFGSCGTWTRGYHFGSSPGTADLEEALPIPYGLHPTAPIQFACERRRGWEEAPGSPPPVPGDRWDQRRNARVRKRQPGAGGDRVLCVESVGWAGGEFGVEQAVDGLRVRYSLDSDGDLELLEDVQWADWDREGRLLVATRSGRLQIRSPRSGGHDVVFDADLAELTPEPTPAPASAANW